MNNVGKKENPLLIDGFNVDLEKLETICNLLDQHYYKRVKSLTAEEVRELDAVANKLGLDNQRFKYLERSQANSQVALTVRGHFYGLVNPSEEQYD